MFFRNRDIVRVQNLLSQAWDFILHTVLWGMGFAGRSMWHGLERSLTPNLLHAGHDRGTTKKPSSSGVRMNTTWETLNML